MFIYVYMYWIQNSKYEQVDFLPSKYVHICMSTPIVYT